MKTQEELMKDMKALVAKFNELEMEFDVFELDEMMNFEVFPNNEDADPITDAMDNLINQARGHSYDVVYELEDLWCASDNIREDSFPRVRAVFDKYDMYNTMENSFEFETELTEEAIIADILKMNPNWTHNPEYRTYRQ